MDAKTNLINATLKGLGSTQNPKARGHACKALRALGYEGKIPPYVPFEARAKKS